MKQLNIFGGIDIIDKDGNIIHCKECIKLLKTGKICPKCEKKVTNER